MDSLVTFWSSFIWLSQNTNPFADQFNQSQQCYVNITIQKQNKSRTEELSLSVKLQCCPRCHQDPSRLYYESAELKLFENIECEWPLFWTYLILDGIFINSPEQVVRHCASLMLRPEQSVKLQLLLICPSGSGVSGGPGGNPDQTERWSQAAARALQRPCRQGPPTTHTCSSVLAPAVSVWENFFCLYSQVEEETMNPHSVERIPMGKCPLAWGQSLYILGNLLSEVSSLFIFWGGEFWQHLTLWHWCS